MLKDVTLIDLLCQIQLIWMNTSDIEQCTSLVMGEELQKRVHPQHLVLVQNILKRFITVLLDKSGFGSKIKEFDMALQNKPPENRGKAGSRVDSSRGGKPTRATLVAYNILNHDGGH